MPRQLTGIVGVRQRPEPRDWGTLWLRSLANIVPSALNTAAQTLIRSSIQGAIADKYRAAEQQRLYEAQQTLAEQQRAAIDQAAQQRRMHEQEAMLREQAQRQREGTVEPIAKMLQVAKPGEAAAMRGMGYGWQPQGPEVNPVAQTPIEPGWGFLSGMPGFEKTGIKKFAAPWAGERPPPQPVPSQKVERTPEAFGQRAREFIGGLSPEEKKTMEMASRPAFLQSLEGRKELARYKTGLQDYVKRLDAEIKAARSRQDFREAQELIRLRDSLTNVMVRYGGGQAYQPGEVGYEGPARTSKGRMGIPVPPPPGVSRQGWQDVLRKARARGMSPQQAREMYREEYGK